MRPRELTIRGLLLGADGLVAVQRQCAGGLGVADHHRLAGLDDLLGEAVGRDAAFAELAAMATPLGRFATAEEIAALVLYLASDESRGVTGERFKAQEFGQTPSF